MFEILGEKLTAAFDRLTGRGVLSAKDIDEALSEVKLALLDADVALPIVKDFITKIREKATGEAVLRAIKPSDQVISIVHQGLVEMLGGDLDTPNDNSGPFKSPLQLSVTPPAVILMVGLQGSGKTTSTAKLAIRLTKQDRKRVLMASLDTRRPAAMEQLVALGAQASIEVLPIVAEQSALEITKRALREAKLGGFDVLILDTAGRTTVDDSLMREVADIAKLSSPAEILLVADSLTGQDAVRTAKAFHEELALTGLILTRIDGDGRGGAALSMRAVTQIPIKFLGSGEKLDALELFDAKRVAGRILGAGDIVALVEKVSAEVDRAKAEKMARKMSKGQFDLDDLAEQLTQMQRMGGLQSLLGFLPGMQKMKNQIADSGLDDKAFRQQVAIIHSMTKLERKKPDILAASRKRRIAKGAGVDVAAVNRLLKQHRQMADMLKLMGRDGGRGLGAMMGALTGKAAPAIGEGQGLPSDMLSQLGGLDMEKLKGLNPSGSQALGSRNLPGLGGLGPLSKGGFPGGHFPGFKKK